MPEITNISSLRIKESSSEIAGEEQLFDAEKPTVIAVENVSMVFNMASEQLNNLKEYFLKIVKHQLFFEEFIALSNISFEVKKGDVFGILGTNGSGKSTLLKIVAGVLEPSEGSVTLNGSIAPLIELGAGFDMDLSARENIFLNGALLGYSKEFIKLHFDEIVEFAEVDKFLDMPMKNYSSGMVARIAFAIATVIVPEILIVDEVLSVGDFMFQQKCENRITELIEEHGVTVLIVSHSNDQIERLCNKAIWIEKGHPRIIGPAARVTELYRLLGGREGSKASEDAILDALVNYPRPKKPGKCKLLNIAGNNSIHVNLKQVDAAWGDEPIKALGLASTFTHTNAVMANGFCGALGIPVVPIGYNELDGALAQWLKNKKPERIYLFDRGSLIEANVLDELKSLITGIDIVTVGEDRDMLGYSCELFEIGYKDRLWNTKAALLPFEDNMESLAAGPYLYHNNIPVFLMKELDDDLSDVAGMLKECGIEKVLFLGSNLPDSQRNTLLAADLDIEVTAESHEAFDSTLAIAEIENGNFEDSTGVLIGNKATSAWPNLLSTGCLGGKLHQPLLLCDCRNLDSIASCISFLEKGKKTEGFNIAGDSGIMDSERALFGRVLAANQEHSYELG